MVPPLKTGPLSLQDLLDVWTGAVDAGYRDPIVEAGDGGGLEVHTQAHAQYARVSDAIDRSTQAMFIVPWSGQTNEPASGARSAQVTITFQRNTRYVHVPMALGAGWIYVEEETSDWGENGAETVLTERRYKLKDNLIFHPGDIGPFDVEAEAEEPGEGHNNPVPGSIKRISQVGAAFENDRASVAVQLGSIVGNLLVSTNTAIITTPNQPDTFVPEHVGQYMLFTAGSNAGKLARIVAFFGPDLSVFPAIGSRAALEWIQSVEGAVVGTFEPGERITRGATTLIATVAGARGSRLSYVLLATGLAMPIAVGDVLTGSASGATITVSSVLFEQNFVAETETAAWRIMDWASSWQLTATNALSPAGGVHPWLDELGFERNFQRASGEDDETYRQRISAISDVVTPNAIRRTLARTLGNIPWCLREVGTEYLPGFFYDGDRAFPSAAPHGAVNDPYDLDVVAVDIAPGFYNFVGQEPVVIEDVTTGFPYVTGYFGRITAGWSLKVIRKTGTLPAVVVGLRVRSLLNSSAFAIATGSTPNTALLTRQYKVWLDYSQFRGFFQVCLPPLGLGEFGFAYDAGPSNAYDLTSPWNTFFDGYPYRNALVYGRVFQALNEARAGGVLLGLCQSDGSCP